LAKKMVKNAAMRRARKVGKGMGPDAYWSDRERRRREEEEEKPGDETMSIMEDAIVLAAESLSLS
jgi:hypothetical protein